MNPIPYFRRLLFVTIFFVTGCAPVLVETDAILAKKREERMWSGTSSEGKITFIYGDREAEVKGCKPAWGMSTLIEFDGMKILFNFGGDPVIFKNNLDALSVDVADIDLVVVSHRHWEMVEGIGVVLSANTGVPVYVTDDLLEDYASYMTHDLGKYAWRPEWESNLYGMSDYLWVTRNILLMKIRSSPGKGGPTGIEEIHIALLTREGLIIAQGCGHPEILDILDETTSYTDEERVSLIFGGTRLLRPGKIVKLPGKSGSMEVHSHGYTDKEVSEIARELRKSGVQRIIPTHCTGEHVEKTFKRIFGDGYIYQRLGTVITVPAPAKLRLGIPLIK
jgi:7,8-dihydropterin-6-yl-methyl-4-(beta-D-ribofuranosyl)aminobenzene 5'-phosphate synthase